MYSIFVKLLQIRNTTAYQVCKATGIASSTISDWKNGKSTPKQDKLKKIADYFGVTLDYLMTGEESETPKLESEVNTVVRIKALRKEKGLTQQELADMLNVAGNTLGYWENGHYEPDLKALIKLADIFDVSVDYIIGRSDVKKEFSALGEGICSRANEIIILNRSGCYVRKRLSDGQLEALKMMIDQLPDVPDDL